METLKTLKTRRSCRAYKAEHVEEEKLNAIIEAGTYAPTGMGKQSPIILVIKDQEIRNKLAKLNAAAMGMEIDPFYGAPELIVVLADKNVRTYVYDGALTMGNMMLEAYNLGVSSCWIHRAKEVFETEEGKAILAKAGVEGDYEGIGNLIIGYADGEMPSPRERADGRVYKI